MDPLLKEGKTEVIHLKEVFFSVVPKYLRHIARSLKLNWQMHFPKITSTEVKPQTRKSFSRSNILNFSVLILTYHFDFHIFNTDSLGTLILNDVQDVEDTEGIDRGNRST